MAVFLTEADIRSLSYGPLLLQELSRAQRAGLDARVPVLVAFVSPDDSIQSERFASRSAAERFIAQRGLESDRYMLAVDPDPDVAYLS